MAPSTILASSLRRPATQLVSLAAFPRSGSSSSSMGGVPATTRSYAQISRNRIGRAMDSQNRAGARHATKEQTISQMQKAAAAEVFKDGGGPLFPGTFIPLPISKVSTSPIEFITYQWWRTKSWLQGVLTVLSIKLQSMPSWTTRPRYKAHRGAMAPTAKAMYREMLEAFAAGDRRALDRLCLPAFAKLLGAAIDKRSPREEVRFELVRDTRRLFYPRLVSHLVHPVNPHDKTQLTEQAVVALSSLQQLSRHARPGGEALPGSLRLQDRVEYVVLARQSDTVTYEKTPWRILGTTRATTSAAYREEQMVIEKEQAHRAGWRPKSETTRK